MSAMKLFARGACALAIAAALVACGKPASKGLSAEADPKNWPSAASPAALTDEATEARITTLLAGMSVEEKVAHIIQPDIASIKPDDLKVYPFGSILAGGGSNPNGDDRAPAKDWVKLAKDYREAAASYWTSKGKPVIPLLFGIDAVHGHSNVVGATIFPHNSGLGATNDPDLVRRIGQATALEVAVTGADWTFAPTVTVPQDDRWGRQYEGYSEDPAIVAKFAPAMTLGLQGELQPGKALEPGRIPGSIKHFLGDGGTKDGRDQGDAQIPESELIRVHAAGYPPSIDAGILTVMASFSSWNGVKMHGNKSLLTDVLKGKMGFNGFVVGDWNAHGQIPGCANDNCAAAINAGLDMFMAPDGWKNLYANTLAQVKDGTIPMARLDDAVRRILRVKIKSGLFEPNHYAVEGKLSELGSPAHRALAREAVRKSLVLIKNDGVLPLKPKARILVAGDGADNLGKQTGGWTLSWQGTGNTKKDFPNSESVYDGLAKAVKAVGGVAELSVDGKFKKKPDVAVVVFGLDPYAEFQGDVAHLDFESAEAKSLALLKSFQAQGIPTVSVFISGRPMFTNPEINASNAFVMAWLPGTEGGGIADLLVAGKDGKPRFDFTGKLSYSWPKTGTQTATNIGDKDYDPLFKLGYGGSYAIPVTVAVLPEESGVAEGADNVDKYFVEGRVRAPWSAFVRDSVGEKKLEEGVGGSNKGTVTLTKVDGTAQENARLMVFKGDGFGEVSFQSAAIDLDRQTNGDLILNVTYALAAAPTKPVRLGIRTGHDGQSKDTSFDVTKLLKVTKKDEWASLKVRLGCFRDAGADMKVVANPFMLSTEGALSIRVTDISVTSNDGSAVCP